MKYFFEYNLKLEFWNCVSGSQIALQKLGLENIYKALELL